MGSLYWGVLDLIVGWVFILIWVLGFVVLRVEIFWVRVGMFKFVKVIFSKKVDLSLFKVIGYRLMVNYFLIVIVFIFMVSYFNKILINFNWI